MRLLLVLPVDWVSRSPVSLLKMDGGWSSMRAAKKLSSKSVMNYPQKQE
jgi:hypothetical protein